MFITHNVVHITCINCYIGHIKNALKSNQEIKNNINFAGNKHSIVSKHNLNKNFGCNNLNFFYYF